MPISIADSGHPLAREAERVMGAARERGMTLVTAESCTGGALAALLADAPGAGEVLHGGFVAYSKANKTVALGVPEALIGRHTAVSAQVAEVMARGALARSPADLGVAVTGVAGPDPDEDGNPVGLVYLAVARRHGAVLEEEHRFGKRSKEEILAATLMRALQLIARALA
jgi:nicotinamide-nucleotide amidase